MGKRKKIKRLSIERSIESESPDTTKENKESKENKEDGCCKCCGILNCFQIEKQTNNNINGNENVIDNNKDATISIGLNKK